MLQTSRTVLMCPTVEHAYLNRVLINPKDELFKYRHIQVAERSPQVVFTLEPCLEMPLGSIGLNYLMRRHLHVSHNTSLSRLAIRPYHFDRYSACIGQLVLSVDFLHALDRENISEVTKLNVDEMAAEFGKQFERQAFWVGQTLAFRFQGSKTLKLVVLQLEEIFSYGPLQTGFLVPNTKITFHQSADTLLSLTRLVNTKINFEATNMTSTGFRDEFIATTKRALEAGHFSAELITGSGISAVKGLLLYGPSGSGKSSAALAFGKLLSATEVEIFNCDNQELSFERLFPKTTSSQGLRLLILDQVDALFRVPYSPSTIPRFYSQLESLAALSNILIIGITSRLDSIPVDLLGPGRFEFQMELTLPSVQGRLEILNLQKNKMEVLRLLDGCQVDLSTWHCMALAFLIVTCGTWEVRVGRTRSVRINRKEAYAMFSAIGPREHVWC